MDTKSLNKATLAMGFSYWLRWATFKSNHQSAKGECIVERDGAAIGHLKAGDYFGEAALINDCARGASVIASTEIKVWLLPVRC